MKSNVGLTNLDFTQICRRDPLWGLRLHWEEFAVQMGSLPRSSAGVFFLNVLVFRVLYLGRPAGSLSRCLVPFQGRLGNLTLKVLRLKAA